MKRMLAQLTGLEVFHVPVQYGLALAVSMIHQEDSMSQEVTATSAQLQNEHRGPTCSLQPSKSGGLPSGQVYPRSNQLPEDLGKRELK